MKDVSCYMYRMIYGSMQSTKAKLMRNAGHIGDQFLRVECLPLDLKALTPWIRSSLFQILKPVHDISVLPQLQTGKEVVVKLITKILLPAVKDLSCDPGFRITHTGEIKAKGIHYTHLSFKLCYTMQEDLNGLFHIMPAVEDGLLNLFLGELPVNVEWYRCLLDVMTHESFHGLQSYRWIRHDIIVIDLNLSEKGRE